ncbi:ATP-dependent zinc protease family protein [Vibrio sp. S17_S38]|uniref:ATP-dependent zinc protease family protein n=1 Tax=Vibrio sp. S17_S38 TaxID=2720229 RepID=UPI001680EE1E|nr:ATP-dependent zinc protease [Vibrio sp. S17_S38]
MKKWGFLFPVVLSIAVVGCSTTPEQAQTNETAKSSSSTNSSNDTKKTVTKEGETAAPKTETKLSPMEKHPNVKPKPMPTVTPKKTKAMTTGIKTPEGKLILGQTEWIHIDGLDINVPARIDTGATTSSVSAVDILAFERDGKKWVKFKLSHEGKTSKELTLPVVSTKFIRQSNSEKTVERYTVKGWVTVGSLKLNTEFTLADRTHMDFGVLLGRSFFRDEAVVDISRQYVQPKVKLGSK